MDIDLTLLHNNSVDTISLNNNYLLDSNYYKNTDIISLSSVSVVGCIKRLENEENNLDDYIECSIKGTMTIPDSISLDEVLYPFTIEYDDFILENWKKNENTLDIFAFLWENILLEVPLQFTKVQNFSKFHGDGWKLITEEEKVLENNPFKDLLKDFEKE